MRRRSVWLFVLGLATWGCGPPQVVPMLPPGYVAPTVTVPETGGGMEAEGEIRARGVMPQSANAPVQPNPALQKDASGSAPAGREKKD